MSHEIYSAASGGIAAMRRMENTSNNLANSQTTGFKGQRIAASTFEEHVAGSQVVVRTEPALGSDGPLIIDEVDTHVALQGRGFFVVQQGESSLLVRRGDFALDASGNLVDTAGRKVMGTGGPITVEPGTKLQIGTDGTVKDVDGEDIATLRVVDADDVSVLGEGVWEASSELRKSDATVVQGALEGSGVNPLLEMVELIEATRAFEALQKAMKTSDELDGMANRMARG